MHVAALYLRLNSAISDTEEDRAETAPKTKSQSNS